MKGKTFRVVKKSECYAVTGKAPKSTKWVDTDKSHGQGPNEGSVQMGGERLQDARRKGS